ncbi:MAG: hypothetical protein E7642_05455 [Ruminococcaceae bacterium]|nr:hypothetical protein [Oscillospiraceae bacterium]
MELFFQYVYKALSGEHISLSPYSKVISQLDCFAYRYAKEAVSSLDGNTPLDVSLSIGIPEGVKSAAKDLYAENDEAYALVIDDGIQLYAASENALIFAVSTLKQLIESNELKRGIIFDYPDKSVRGYRVFIPGRNSFGAFREVIDTMVYYKYNSIILEVGGAMEYKRHPEINEKWIEFCKEVHQSPYEAGRIQHRTHPQWLKNSIHADNGDGEFITQDELSELLDYCRERGLEVIPEVPCLSHSDYIVMAHPELNERVEDTYPDTYCPSNPKTYELVFDIIDEVIEVFKPRYVHIGHDEMYTLAQCELCRGKDPVELYVGDIIKINDYLKARGIRTIMWCEKMFQTHISDEWPGGGSAFPKWNVPALYECKKKIPRDVLLLHWYWSIVDYEDEQSVLDLGYDMLFGNFSAINLSDYKKRSSRISGGFCSNWGSFEYPYMQRNRQNLSLVCNAYIFWNRDYDSEKKDEVFSKVSKRLHSDYIEKFCSNTDSLIEIEHTTDTYIKHNYFYDGYFIDEKEWLLGNYVISYTDGTTARLPVLYGYNICYSCSEIEFGDDMLASECSKEAIGASLPFEHEGNIWYKTVFENPYPQKKIDKIEYIKIKEATVNILNIKY